jgi:hypothetical protein
MSTVSACWATLVGLKECYTGPVYCMRLSGLLGIPGFAGGRQAECGQASPDPFYQ